jgi:hypothetical protein
LSRGLEYETPELLGIEEFLTLGWVATAARFIDQPLEMFVNNAVERPRALAATFFSSGFRLGAAR